ncbi:MAG: PPC domain-containing DNA-binding protein [Bacillota bacterium]
MMVKEFKPGRHFMARIDHDADLLKYLEEFAAKNHIKAGHFAVIGAVKSAAIGFYEQKSSRYEVVRFDRHLEIGNCLGNFSIRDGKPAVHAHITLGDEAGRAFTGHLMEGTRIFAGELWATEMPGDTLERVPDEVTKLSLWRF